MSSSRYMEITGPLRGYIETPQGIYWENTQTRTDQPAVRVIGGPYQQVILNLSGEPDYNLLRFTEQVEESRLLVRKQDNEWEFGLTEIEPFGTCGRPVLTTPLQNWVHEMRLPKLSSERVLYQRMEAPNLARICGLANRKLVDVSNTPLDGYKKIQWFSAADVRKLLEQKEIRTSSTFYQLWFALADPYGLLSGNGWKPSVDMTSLSEKISKLHAISLRATNPKSAFYIPDNIIEPEYDSGTTVSNKDKLTAWQIDRATHMIHRLDKKFFTVRMFEDSMTGKIFPGLIEEGFAYNGSVEKEVGGGYCPVKVENDKVMIGLVPWNRPGNGGETVAIIPRWSSSSGEAQGRVQKQELYRKPLHTYEWCLTGIAECKVILDPDYCGPKKEETVWFEIDELLMLSDNLLNDPLSLAMIYWVIGNQNVIKDQAK